MDTDYQDDAGLAARLKRLDTTASHAPPFDYDAMYARRELREARARRRSRAASATATMLVVALVGASVWRIDQRVDVATASASAEAASSDTAAVAVAADGPHMVRADTWLAVAALEDHIASVDDALSEARAYAPRGGEVARLERVRAELMDSYNQVRYAERVSANF